ncbi:HNH endonuclease [Pseudomonas sp. MWU13-2625]|nr:HNH endonuclease [Pseudomonas sp. MWU13-2625]
MRCSMPEVFLRENDEFYSAFDKHYKALYVKVFDCSDRSRINISSGDDSGVCKYCGRGEGETTFKKVSHAIPMALSNRTLIDSLECDQCNKHFADYLEDSFLKFTLPHRIVNTIRGRSNPKYRNENFEITFTERGQIKIDFFEGGAERPGVETVEGDHYIRLPFVRQSYRPIAVYKMFTKMALALMPVAESSRLAPLKEWILNKDHARLFSGVPVIQYEFQGTFDPDIIKCGLFKVKEDFEAVYFRYVFVLVFGNLQYCVVIPDPATEQGVSKTMLVFPALVERGMVEECGAPAVEKMYFESEEIVRGEEVCISMHFATREELN